MSLAARWRELAPAAPSSPDDEVVLADAIRASRATWPGVDVPDDEWLAYLAVRVAPDVVVRDALASVCAPDLWLACAIGRGDREALRAFDAIVMAQLDAAIAHLDGGSALIADVRAAVVERVLPLGGHGKLADYRGRGDLRGWLRVVAVREALQLLRARRREAPMPEQLVDQLDDAPPLLSPAERDVYRDAFATALASLTPRERNLLRHHYLHGATVDELGALYGVHRATPARWIAQIRETLARRTRQHVGLALHLTGTELDSAMGKLGSHLDYSLRHTLSNEP